MRFDLTPIRPRPDTLSPAKYRRAIATARGRAEVLALQELQGSVRGWRHKVRFSIARDGDESTVTTDDPVFIYQDRGTRPHTITPRRKRYLRFAGRSGTVYAKRVNHPGNPAQKFTDKAAERAQREFERAVVDELAKVAP